MRRPVGKHKAVQAEIPVVLKLAVVAAVPVHGFPVRRCSLIDGMVAPLPDKTAAQAGILFRQIPVFLLKLGPLNPLPELIVRQVLRILLPILPFFLQSGSGLKNILLICQMLDGKKALVVFVPSVEALILSISALSRWAF